MAVEIHGPFEVHLTVAADPGGLRRLCAARGWKCVHILLARGATPSQPMVTYHTAGSTGTVLAAARLVEGELRQHGFPVTRIKIEAAPTAAGVPQTDADPHPPGGYFEHHVKLDRPAADPLDELTALATRHAAHLSRNAFKDRADGREERFVTLRCFGVGRATAAARLDDLLGDLRTAGHRVVSVESEYSAFDSHLELDAGWLDAADPTP